MERHLGRTAMPDPRDRHLTMALVYGVARWRPYLDWIAAKFSKQPLPNLHPLVRQALRIGLFQLVFLDRIPVSAAVNETVGALRLSKQPKWLAGFVNGVLRAACRVAAELPDPRRDDSSLPEPVRFCHPEWLTSRWQKRYGREATRSLCHINNTPPRLCLRTNTRKNSTNDLLATLKQAGFRVEQGDYAPDALYLPDFQGEIHRIPGFAAGSFQVQDEAAQLVAYLLGPPRSGGIYLDGCAGLGGKTTHLTQLLLDDNMVMAIEPDTMRARLLAENIARLDCTDRVECHRSTLQELLPAQQGRFAGVLIDAPCSGLGVIRRHPDIRWNRTEADLPRYQNMQLELLHSAALLVQPGGALVYATCSLEPEENEIVVEKFLARHQEFTLTPAGNFLPQAAKELVDDEGCLRTRPDLHDLDGFFAARFKKRTERV
jgi:16S rRNA (cytosine967-C5)-methyltransferase